MKNNALFSPPPRKRGIVITEGRVVLPPQFLPTSNKGKGKVRPDTSLGEDTVASLLGSPHSELELVRGATPKGSQRESCLRASIRIRGGCYKESAGPAKGFHSFQDGRLGNTSPSSTIQSFLALSLYTMNYLA